MQRFELVFAREDHELALEFELVDSSIAQAWASAVNGADLIYTGFSSMPTEQRIAFKWAEIAKAVAVVNDEHLLDEWLHFPRQYKADLAPALLKKIRNRAQIHEEYSAHNNLSTATRTACRRLLSLIPTLEYMLDTVDNKSACWFKWADAIVVPHELRTSTISSGQLALTSPGITRQLDEARKFNDTESVSRKLIKPWDETNRAIFTLSGIEENKEKNQQWITEQTLTLDVDNYMRNYFVLANLVTPVDNSTNLFLHTVKRITFK
jgi:hypothetical protein